MSCVYALSSSADPENIRYVGRTKHDTPDKRFDKHLSKARSNAGGRVYNWIRSVEQSGSTVVCVSLEDSLTYEESAVREIAHITDLKARGFDLTNMTNGGEGTLGRVVSPEARAKISETLKERMSPEIREKNGSANRGKPMSTETRAKIAETLRGRTLTPEHVENAAAGHRGKTYQRGRGEI